MYLGDDSFFLSETLEKYLKNKKKQISILDVGSSTGIQAETCMNSGFTDVLAIDINPESIKLLKKKKIKAKQSNLFSDINEKFDLIIFNPPYLPEDKYDKEKDTSGGKRGDETIIRFLKQARKHLSKKGEILLLISSFTPRKNIEEILEKYYKKEILAEKKLFFETLEIWRISLKLSLLSINQAEIR